MLAVAKRKPVKVDRNNPVVAGIEWILANRRQEDGSPWSPRAFAAKAGMSPGALAHLLAGRQSADLKTTTLRKYAKAGNVRTEWLGTGRGEREPYEGDPEPVVANDTSTRTVHLDERYPTIALVFARMRQTGIDESILDLARLALGVFKSDEGPTEQQVEDAVLNELKQRRRYKEMIGRDIDDL